MFVKSERWLPVVGYEGFYAIGDYGEVYRLKAGKGARPGIRTAVSNGHYLKITLSRDNLARQFYVHHLVARAFLGPRNGSAQVNHKDGNKLNNHFLNLEYVSPQENTVHAFTLGLIRRAGEHNANAKLTQYQVAEIRESASAGVPRKELAERFGVRRHTISQIVTGKRWRDGQRLPDVREL